MDIAILIIVSFVLFIQIIQFFYSLYIGSFLVRMADVNEETREAIAELKYISMTKRSQIPVPPDDVGLVDLSDTSLPYDSKYK